MAIAARLEYDLRRLPVAGQESVEIPFVPVGFLTLEHAADGRDRLVLRLSLSGPGFEPCGQDRRAQTEEPDGVQEFPALRVE